MKIVPQSFHGFWSSDRSLRVFLWLLVCYVFVLMPFDLISGAARVVMSIFFSLLLIAGANAVSRSRKVLVVVSSVLFFALLSQWLDWIIEHEAVDILGAATGAVFLLILAGLLGAMVVNAQKVSLHTIEGGIAIYLLLAMLWSHLYLILELLHPGSFDFAVRPETPAGIKATLSYFSLITVTTVGYGDIIAVHPAARSLAALEAFVGQLYPAVLLARLVSLEIISRSERLD